MHTPLKMSCFAIGLASVIASTACLAHGQPFVVDGHRIAAGHREDFELQIPAGASDPATKIPVTVIHGASKGPVLAIVAGVHGFEFASVLALAQISEQISPKSLAGTLVLVRLAHVSAFEERSPYVNPFDRKNLNRAFPGHLNGTQTERIAWALSTKIVAKADFLIDVHSGDGAEWLASFVGVYGGPLSSNYPQALAVAEAFQFERIVRYSMNTQLQVDRRRSLNRQGVAAGIPTVLVEIGENGSRRPEDVKAIVDGIHRTLAVLKMTRTPLPSATHTPLYFDGTSSVPVQHAGVWTPQATGGRILKQGETIGVLRSYHGRVLETVKAPTDGYALYGLNGPPVKSGQSVVTIAHPASSIQPSTDDLKTARPKDDAPTATFEGRQH
ncbi:MAG: succinylglutamate desuccinylase/aspartoacylase family protein [Myxococcota bacterium]